MIHLSAAIVPKTKAIWAIDPFQTETRPSPAAAMALAGWAAAQHISIQPVYLAPPAERWTPHRLSSAVRMVDGYIQALGLKGVLPSEVFSAEAEMLVRMAEHLASPFIIVSSHGRSGVQRYTLGSFAELLLTEATRPVLFLSKSNSEDLHRFDTILFATDFSDRSFKCFEDLLHSPRASSREIVIYHSVCLNPATMASNYGIPVLVPENYFLDQMKWAEDEGRRWEAGAYTQGVKVRVVIENEGVHAHVGSSILAAAKNNHAGLIAIRSNSGSAGSLLFGKIAKQVFRSQERPVLVYGPRYRSSV